MSLTWMKKCRYCRYFDTAQGCCTKGIFEVNLEDNIDTIIEDGYIEEAIREGFTEKKFNSISKRKQAEFNEEFEEMKVNWIEEISDRVARMLINKFSHEYKIMPKDTRDFYCSQWD